MQIDKTNRVCERLHFEKAIRTAFVTGIPIFCFVIVTVFCLALEYPVHTFNDIRRSIDTLMGLKRETDFAINLPTVVSEILNKTEGMYPAVLANSSNSNSERFSSLLLGSIVYFGEGVEFPCDLPDACYDKSRFHSTNEMISDPKLGVIPISIISNITSFWELPRGINLLALNQLYYTGAVDMYTLVHARYMIDVNGIYRSDYFISTFHQYDAYMIFMTSISVGVFLIEFFLYYKKRNNIFSLSVAIFALVLFVIKWKYTIDYRTIATNLISEKDWTPVIDKFFFSDVLRTMSNILLVLLLFRTILLLSSIHPRLGMLVKTLEVGFGDFVHFAFVFLSILLWFSFLGCILFGSNYYYMSTFTRSVFVHFQFLMGSISFLTDTYTPLLMSYFIIFAIVMIFASMFLLLALIVNAYQEFVDELETSVCGTVLRDWFHIWIRYPYRRFRGHWPSSERMLTLLEKDHLDQQNCIEMYLYYARWGRTPKKETSLNRIENLINRLYSRI